MKCASFTFALMPGDQTSTLDSCVLCSNTDEWKPICVLTDHNYSLPIVTIESVCGHSVSHNVCYCAVDTGRESIAMCNGDSPPCFCFLHFAGDPLDMKIRQYLLVPKYCFDM